MEIPFAADHIAVKKKGISMLLVQNKYFMKFDVGTEVSFTFKESINRFLSCLHEPYMINSVLELFIFRWFSLIQLLMLLVCFFCIT